MDLVRRNMLLLSTLLFYGVGPPFYSNFMQRFEEPPFHHQALKSVEFTN
jgi:hypothetical protein